MAGVFHQPVAVISDINSLRTLPRAHLVSGLAEVIKYGAILDAGLFTFIEKNYNALIAAQPTALEHAVTRCSAIKASVVARDERETKNLRTILNFGHTLGHALETASGYRRFSHGEAVGWGMHAAGLIGTNLGVTPAPVTQRLKRLLIDAGFSLRVRGVSPEKILAAHFHDKKFQGKNNRFVLLTNIGKARVCEQIPLTAIRAAVKAATA
jgi:3-dehydroquinate synthase